MLIETVEKIGYIIDNLGGVISIGEVLVFGRINDLIKSLDKKELYFGTKNKFNYSIWNFAEESSKEIISYYLK